MSARWPQFCRVLVSTAITIAPLARSQEAHEHTSGPEVGEAHFAVSCNRAVQGKFDRAVALLHSFDYGVAEITFQAVAQEDPECAMAWWGAAMTHFHQLWQPPLPPRERATAQQQIAQAQRLIATTKRKNSSEVSAREYQFIAASALIFQSDATAPFAARVDRYEQAMAKTAAANPGDVEAQMFYALALLANAPPADKTHAKQKKAADILEPLYAKYPQHPGAVHYLIHAYDNAEMAARGLPFARVYAKIAPTVPHAQHMPSHIFTRLGMWEDSIASNRVARRAAHRAGDTGEELHTMDYLVYAYLQVGRDGDARDVVAELNAMPTPNLADFKIGYAATAIPIRCMVEREDWQNAIQATGSAIAPPEVKAIVSWAQGLGLTRGERRGDAAQQITDLQNFEDQLRAAGNTYWAGQTKILKLEVMGWAAHAQDQPARAEELLRTAADEEDATEKLPVTPGPIVPAREQLAQLLLVHQQWDAAEREFRRSLTTAPGRRNAIHGLEEANKRAQSAAR